MKLTGCYREKNLSKEHERGRDEEKLIKKQEKEAKPNTWCERKDKWKSESRSFELFWRFKGYES